MAAIYFPDVPEYQPFISLLSKRWGIRSQRGGGYVAFTSDLPIVLERSETGLEEAVWFGALVAGFQGQIATFNGRVLQIS